HRLLALSLFFFSSILRRPPSTTLFPYTTLFRSRTVPARRTCSSRSTSVPRASRRERGSTRSSCASSERRRGSRCAATGPACRSRSEQHTSELQSRFDLVCRLLLEKKKKKQQSPR